MNRSFTKEISSVPVNAKISATTIAKQMPPIAPSIVLLGLISGHSFVFPKASLMIDLSAVQKSEDLGSDTAALIAPENLIQRTKAMIDTDGTSSGYLSVLRDGSREIYVKTKYIKLFGSLAEFYQGKAGCAIAVVEADRLCGVIAPVQYTPEDDY